MLGAGLTPDILKITSMGARKGNKTTHRHFHKMATKQLKTKELTDYDIMLQTLVIIACLTERQCHRPKTMVGILDHLNKSHFSNFQAVSGDKP